jgi:GTPase SAR1 family protein
MKKTKIINLFGGPGVGKSTITSGIFYELKKRNISCDNPYEFPKQVAWENNKSQITDQLFIFANQHRGIVRSYGKVDFIILDSPILLSLTYKDGYNNGYPTSFYGESFDKMVIDVFKKYPNINFLLNNEKNEYENEGRFQDQLQSSIFHEKIKNILKEYDLPYINMDVGDDTVDKIIKLITCL